jgi:hypothetical protein
VSRPGFEDSEVGMSALDKLFIVKQSIIIYKIQARFIRAKSACVPSTNTFPYFMRPLHRE